MLHVSNRFFVLLAGLIFTGVGILHAYRAATGIDLLYGDYLIPIWVSWLAVFVTFILALAAFRHAV